MMLWHTMLNDGDGDMVSHRSVSGDKAMVRNSLFHRSPNGSEDMILRCGELLGCKAARPGTGNASWLA